MSGLAAPLGMEFGIVAFSSLFAMMDPIAAAPIFISMTAQAAERRRQLAIRASITAGIALLVFAVAGSHVFSFFHITVPAFQIAGGLLFLLSSLKTLQGAKHEGADAAHDADPSIVPLGIPVIAGAGSLSTVMVLAAQARHQAEHFALTAAIIANVIICLVILLISPAIVKRLGPSATEVISKVMGLITAVIGVQFIINGLTAVILEASKKMA